MFVTTSRAMLLSETGTELVAFDLGLPQEHAQLFASLVKPVLQASERQDLCPRDRKRIFSRQEVTSMVAA